MSRHTGKFLHVPAPDASASDAAFTFADICAGVGGFHAALAHAEGRCVYVSEIDDAALATHYQHNWGGQPPAPQVNRGITTAVTASGVDVPEQDILTANSPRQPFSTSGHLNRMDEIRGTVFGAITRVLEARRPSVVLLENVRNLAGPRHRHGWEQIVRTLRELGYRLPGVPQIFSPHLPPAQGGTPQVRERAFMVATQAGPDLAWEEALPVVSHHTVDGWDPSRWQAEWALAPAPRDTLTPEEVEWINTWDGFVQRMRKNPRQHLPRFPLWSDYWREDAPRDLPGLPHWKQNYTELNQNSYYRHHRIRPSRIHCKALTYLSALVAITQTSIYGPWCRRLTPAEVVRLQGLSATFQFHNDRPAQSYKQAGNGVPADVAWHVLPSHVSQARSATIHGSWNTSAEPFMARQPIPPLEPLALRRTSWRATMNRLASSSDSSGHQAAGRRDRHVPPELQNDPPALLQPLCGGAITSLVGRQPKTSPARVDRWLVSVLWASVPEAAIDKDLDPEKSNVDRPTSVSGDREADSMPAAFQEEFAPKQEFRTRVFSGCLRHPLRKRLGRGSRMSRDMERRHDHLHHRPGRLLHEPHRREMT